MIAEIVLRPPQVSDHQGWEKLFKAYRVFYHKEPCKEIARRVWQWMGDLSEDFHGVLAVQDEEILGFAHYHPTLDSLTGSRTLLLDDLFVAEEHRRKGVGRQLVSHIREHAERMGCARVRWITEEDNIISRQLYDQYGTQLPFAIYDITLS